MAAAAAAAAAGTGAVEKINQIIHQRARTANKSAAGTQGFAECAHLDFDPVTHAEFFGQTTLIHAIQAGAVGFIHHEPRAVFLLEFNDVAEWRSVAIHGENGFGGDEDLELFGAGGGALGVSPLEDFLQIGQIIVVEDTQRRTAQAGGVHDGGVNEFVQNDNVVPGEQGAQGSGGGGIAGGEGEGGFGLLKFREGSLQLMKRRERTTDQAGGSTARAVTVDRVDCGLAQGRVIGEAKIIVRGKIEKWLSGDLEMGGLGGIHPAQFAVQPLLP
jgi:hypothetical protein